MYVCSIALLPVTSQIAMVGYAHQDALTPPTTSMETPRQEDARSNVQQAHGETTRLISASPPVLQDHTLTIKLASVWLIALKIIVSMLIS